MCRAMQRPDFRELNTTAIYRGAITLNESESVQTASKIWFGDVLVKIRAHLSRHTPDAPDV
jgi:hypothetical protein